MDTQYFLQPGTLLDKHYRIRSLLGDGGMGAVYRAQDELLDCLCAVKELRLRHLPTEADFGANLTMDDPASRVSGKPRVTREMMKRQFTREAQLLNKLDHENLPKVKNFFDQDDNLYLVMTLVEGDDLEIKLEHHTGPFTAEQVVGWTDQVLDALTYCHEHGVIHRDIKPANIIVTPEDKAYLVDFGIARYNDATQTTVSAQAGTPGFSPPEQYTIGTDPRSDLYSLGATMYVLLSGEPPPEAFVRSEEDTLKPLSALVPNIAPALDAAVMKALAIKRSDRFQSAREMRLAVQAAMQPTAPESPLPPRLMLLPEIRQRLKEFAPRRGLVLAGLVLVAAMAILVVVIGNGPPPPQPGETQSPPTETSTLTPPKTTPPGAEIAPGPLMRARSFTVTLPSPLDRDRSLGLPTAVGVTLAMDKVAIKPGLTTTVSVTVTDKLHDVQLLLEPQRENKAVELEVATTITCEFRYANDVSQLVAAPPAIPVTIDTDSPFEILLTWSSPSDASVISAKSLPLTVNWQGSRQQSYVYTEKVQVLP